MYKNVCYHWLYNSMTPKVATQLLQCQTLKELWKVAKEFSSVHTCSHIMMYKSEFQRMRKGAMKMEVYLNKMKFITNNLALVGSPIPSSNLITQVLARLDVDYNPIVV